MEASDPLHAAERHRTEGAKRAERQLADLRASNQHREERLHERELCTESTLTAVRMQAFLDTAIDALGVRPEFELAVERLKADGYDAIESQLADAERTQREQALLQGVGAPPRRVVQ